jgi:hypothetical protein
VRCTFQFDPVRGGLAAGALPAGAVVLRRRPAEEYTRIDRWPSLGSLVITSGTVTRFEHHEAK